jgi:hypothetical protein
LGFYITQLEGVKTLMNFVVVQSVFGVIDASD